MCDITQNEIEEAYKKFDGTCPFWDKASECGKGCMTLKECNKCPCSEDYRKTDKGRIYYVPEM